MNEKEYLDRLHRLWEKNWPAHVPKEPYYPLGEIPLAGYLREWAKRTPDKPCLIYYGAEITFKQLDELSDRFAAYLAAGGLKKGDRVGVFLPNCPQFHIAFFGILKLGCVHVPLNPMFKEREFIYEMNDTEASVVVALDQLFPIVQAAKDKTSLRQVLVTSLADFLPVEPTLPLNPMLTAPRQECPDTVDLIQVLEEQEPDCPEVEVSLDDVAALNYTGGTTGLPKGCEHTHRNMIYTAATGAACNLGASAEDVIMAYMPIFWIAGEDAGILLPVFCGMSAVLLTRWDAEAVLKAIERYKVTVLPGVMDNIVELIERPDASKYDLSSLKTVGVASFVKKLNVDYRRRWKELSESSLREISYGMTETHTIDTFTIGLQTDDLDLKSRPIFCGLPMPGTRFKICDFETGALLPLGQEGEIVISTPSLMKSYWNKPEETKNAIKDGWLHTGDIGMLTEEGYLVFLGRRKEMLKTKGMSVFPSEIESLLGQHPAVAGSGVIGRSDPEKGQTPAAFIMLKPDYEGRVTEDELKEWCKKNMAAYKVPTIKFVKQLPMTATGKVIKDELKKELD